MQKPVCLVVHALFADASYAELKVRSDQIASTDTIPHPSNAVSIANLLLPRAH